MIDIKIILEWLINIITGIGIIVILWGIILSVIKFFRVEKAIIRQELGSYLVLGLEFFIAADIIKTVIKPTWQDIGILAAIVGIRTVLSYFLSLELRQKV